MKRSIASAALFLAALSNASFASAQTTPAPVPAAPAQVSIGNDTYMAGEQVKLTVPANGNLNILAGNVTIATTVAGDLQIAGGDVTVSGGIRDNVRVLGGDVRISGRVNGTLTVVSGQVHIEKTAVIGGGLLATGGKVTIDGTVNGMLKATAGSVTVNGIVNGITEIHADDAAVNGIVGGNATVAANSFVVGNTANFRGKLDYWSQQGQQKFPAGRVTGVATFKPELAPHAGATNDGKAVALGILGGLSLFSVFSAALTLGLFLFLTKNFFKEAAKSLQKQPWMSLLTGILFFLLTPIVALLFFATIIGIPVGILIVLGYFAVMFFSTTFASMTFARWIELRKKKKWRNVTVFFVALGIFIALKLLLGIPFLGWLANSVLVTTGVGAFLSAKYQGYKKVR